MIKSEGKHYKDQIMDMWQRNFHDPVPYMEFYFDHIYEDNEVLINEGEDGALRGMLHLNPYTLCFDGDPLPAHYIVGVATDKEYRRQGVMRELLLEAFDKLRARGEFFTYLMPADEAYYLPFDFRFGADWIETELEVRFLREKSHSFEVTEELKDEETAAAAENLAKDHRYRIHTRISAGYYQCLERESASEFGKVFYVYEQEKYAGRFVVGAQHDFMILSRISCCVDERVDFLTEILDFCEQRYHYGKYQLILDEQWKETVGRLKDRPEFRVFSFRKKPMIMFRLLDLERAGAYIRSNTDVAVRLRVTDRFIPEMNGDYIIDCSGDSGRIAKCDSTVMDTVDGGIIHIGDLTDILFSGISKEDIDKLEDLSDDGRQQLKEIIPWCGNCIMEYV